MDINGFKFNVDNPFAIWYDDGSCVQGSTWEEWLAAPVDGVQVIERLDPITKGLTRFRGKDYYYPVGGENMWINGTDEIGPLLRQLGFVKIGRCMNDPDYRELTQKIKAAQIFSVATEPRPGDLLNETD